MAGEAGGESDLVGERGQNFLLPSNVNIHAAFSPG